jgi:hypothetical protein
MNSSTVMIKIRNNIEATLCAWPLIMLLKLVYSNQLDLSVNHNQDSI